VAALPVLPPTAISVIQAQPTYRASLRKPPSPCGRPPRRNARYGRRPETTSSDRSGCASIGHPSGIEHRARATAPPRGFDQAPGVNLPLTLTRATAPPRGFFEAPDDPRSSTIAGQPQLLRRRAGLTIRVRVGHCRSMSVPRGIVGVPARRAVCVPVQRSTTWNGCMRERRTSAVGAYPCVRHGT